MKLPKGKHAVEFHPLSGDHTVRLGALQLNNPVARANGEDVRLEVPATLRNEKTMVPLRFVSEALHYEVTWNAPKQVIEMKSKKE
ncbi:copper amine oxidase N-terminal domain-containing protein [Paenibacillus ehimensis]|uniref:copper amine oxidase N-terminal domain-containing protein n=1 Tax=Paenibacillus ehimensis TaxID=79264 RepID=UPI000FD7354D